MDPKSPPQATTAGKGQEGALPHAVRAAALARLTKPASGMNAPRQREERLAPPEKNFLPRSAVISPGRSGNQTTSTPQPVRPPVRAGLGSGARSDLESWRTAVRSSPGVSPNRSAELGNVPAPAKMAERLGLPALPLPKPVASEALLVPSTKPQAVRGMAVILKWGGICFAAVGVAFLAFRFLVPVVNELRHPGGTDAIANQDASTAVRLIQQTRSVVAKNDANVAYVNSIVASVDEKQVAPVPPPQPPAREARSANSATTTPARDLTPYEQAVARLVVSGVVAGPEPRVYLNGRIVQFGEIIDRDYALRFVGVDGENRAVLFTNIDNVIFRKYY